VTNRKQVVYYLDDEFNLFDKVHCIV